MSRKLFVGSLDDSVSETQLEAAFASYGTVTSAKVITDRDSGRPRGFGFVEMSTRAEANAAMAGLNGTMLGHKSLVVNEAKPKAAPSRW